ncbi:Ig-like domain-containing protein [Exiguobacterium sp. s161]|uniref:Ig-like domain-containing protein n=1 Tax=Exiguobacterium sp. s161 TaxID=2751191 RepID=UPI001BEC617B|nr:Ig-like domain-containing protein [Exiguobacterium sp. s161]
MGTKKSNKLYAAAAALAVTASAVAPGLTADAASKVTVKSVTNPASISHYGGYTFAVKKLSLPKTVKVLLSNKKYENRSVKWGKVSYDKKYIGKYQTISGTVSGTTKKASIKVKLNNYPVDVVEPKLAPVAVGEKLNLPSTIDVKYKDGKVIARSAKSFNLTAEKTDKAGEMKLSYNYMGKNSSIKGSIAYEVKAAEITNVMNEIKDDMLSVSADVKYPAKDAKAEVLVYALKDMTKEPIKIAAELKDGKLTAKSPVLPDGTHAFVVKVGDVVSPAKDFVVEAPMVKEVKAINATEAQITFNKPVLESVAETAANYSFTSVAPAASATLAIEDIQLQADGKTAIVRFTSKVEAPTTAQLEGASYKVTAQNLLTADYKKVADFTGEYKFSDKVAPVLKGAMVNSNSLELSFDEEVDFSTAILRVDGQQVTVSGATLVEDEAGKYVYELAVSGSVVSEGTHAVTLVSAKDLAGNEAGTLTTSYVVSKDVTAPTVKSIEAVSADTFKVKFSENIQLPNPSIKVMKGAIQYNASLIASTGSEYTYRVAADTGNGVNPLYGTNDSSVSLSVEVSNFKDEVNLIGKTYTGSVTLSKDKTAPALLNQALNTINVVGGNTVITVPFTEELSIDGNTNSKVKVINPDGVELSATVARVTGSKGANTALEVTVTGTPIAGNYQVVFASGAVTDVDNNANAAFTTSVKYDASQQYVSFDTVVDANGVGSVSVPSKNVIAVDFNEEVGTSALNVANYKLDNAALPAGTTAVFTSAAKDVVELRLPASFKVVSDAAYKFEITKDVKNAAGSMIVADATAATKANYTTTVNLLDNVAPTLKAAVLKNSGAAVTTDANEVELTFSEILPAIAANANNADDFIVKINGVEKAVTIKANDAQDDKVVLSLGEAFNASQTVTVQVAGTDLNIADLGGNVIVGGTTVTASK